MTNELSTAREALEQRLRWLLTTIDSLDLTAPEAAVACLNERHALESEDVRIIRDLLADVLRDGSLVLNEMHPGVKQGCVERELGDYSVSALLIEGRGRGHTHPEGEIGLGLRWEGEPTFDGHGPGWVVFPPGSHHVPEVTGGEMLFLFFRPHGEVVWDAIQDNVRE